MLILKLGSWGIPEKNADCDKKKNLIVLQMKTASLQGVGEKVST